MASKECFPGTAIRTETQQLFDLQTRKFRALTFDNLAMADNMTSIHPHEVQLGGWITQKIRLPGAPIMSAAMDTVTGERMAKVMAQNGGIGVIPRNLTPEQQADIVAGVKRRGVNSCRIRHPVTFSHQALLSQIQKEIEGNQLEFTSFPIVEQPPPGTPGGPLFRGLITQAEIQEADAKGGGPLYHNPPASDFMKPGPDVVTAPEEITDEEALEKMKTHRVRWMPVVDPATKELCGLYLRSDLEKHLSRRRSQYTVDEQGRFRVGAAIGFSLEDMPRVDQLHAAGCDVLVLDSSHGACMDAVDQLKRIKERYPDQQVILGNVASYPATVDFLKKTAPYFPDGIKVGIGPSGICTTREQTGCGVPQITAVYQVWRAVTTLNGEGVCPQIPVIADGGIRTPGDCVKAFCCGASAIMIGGVLARTDASPGQVIPGPGGGKFKIYRGMGSEQAQAEWRSSRERYGRDIQGQRSSTVHQESSPVVEERLTTGQRSKIAAEGVQGMVPYEGTTESALFKLAAGIQAGCSHAGTKELAELPAKATLWRQTVAGTTEGRTHSIII